MGKWNRAAVVIATCLCAAGCSRLWAPKPKSFAPVVERTLREFPFSSPSHSPRRSEKPGGVRPEDLRAPIIQLQAYFVFAATDDMKALGLDPSAPASVLSAEQTQALLAQARSSKPGRLAGARFLERKRSPKSGLLLAPKLRVYSGQGANFQALTNYNYVREMGAGGEPVIGNCPAGVMLDVRAEVAGDAVAFTDVRPWYAALVGIFHCRGKLYKDGRSPWVDWQEPVVLVAEPDDGLQDRYAVPEGKSLLVPLRYALVVPRWPIRRLVKTGQVQMQKDGTAEFLARFDERGYPVRQHPVYVLLTPTLVQPDAEAKKPGEPSKRAAE